MKKLCVVSILAVLLLTGISHAAVLSKKEERIVEKVEKMVQKTSVEKLRRIDQKLSVVLERLPKGHKHIPILTHIKQLVSTHIAFSEKQMDGGDYMIEDIAVERLSGSDEEFILSWKDISNYAGSPGGLQVLCSAGGIYNEDAIVAGGLERFDNGEKSGTISLLTADDTFVSQQGTKKMTCDISVIQGAGDINLSNNSFTITYTKSVADNDNTDYTEVLEQILKDA